MCNTKIMMHARLMCFVFDVSGFQNETEDGSPPSGFVAAVEQRLYCCAMGPRIRAAGYPCPALHPARRAHALTACPRSRVFVRTCCVLGRHLDDTWTSSPSSSACRGRRRGPASENEVAPTRLKVRSAWSLPGPRSPPRLCVLHPREP